MIQCAPDRRFVAVIAALEVEARQLRQAIARLSNHQPVRVFQSGAGSAASRRAAQRAIQAGAGALVSWGLAGGLAADLKTGNVIVSAEAKHPSGAVLHGHYRWAAQLKAQLPDAITVHHGPLLCTEQILNTPAAKVAAERSSGALGADMETYAVAAAAEEHGLPWVAVRVVVDAVADRLPVGLDACLDCAGNIRLLGLLGILARPGQWSALANTVRCYRQAEHSLAYLARQLVPAAFAMPRVSERS